MAAARGTKVLRCLNHQQQEEARNPNVIAKAALNKQEEANVMATAALNRRGSLRSLAPRGDEAHASPHPVPTPLATMLAETWMPLPLVTPGQRQQQRQAAVERARPAAALVAAAVERRQQQQQQCSASMARETLRVCGVATRTRCSERPCVRGMHPGKNKKIGSF